MASTYNNNNGANAYNIYQKRQEAESQREQAREIMQQQQQSGVNISAIYDKLYKNLSKNEQRAVNRGNNPAFLEAVYAKMQRPGGRHTRRHRSKSRRGRSKSRRSRR